MRAMARATTISISSICPKRFDLPIFDTNSGKKIGRIVDLAARTSHVYPKITALIASIHGTASLHIFPGAMYT